MGGLQHRLARNFNVQVADWQDTCRELPSWEDSNLLDSPTSDRLTEHAAILDELERVGEWLSKSGIDSGFADGATLEQIHFTLRDLRDSRDMWHSEPLPLLKQEILRDCFNES